MPFDHPEKIATRCKHTIHPSSSSRTPWCPRCTISTAQMGLELVRKTFEVEGGPDAPSYMHDSVWNRARLQYLVKTSRVEKTMRNDCLRRERERVWEEAHQAGSPPQDNISLGACTVCAISKKVGRRYAKPIMPLTTAWWEHEGALVDDRVLVPNSPPDSTIRTIGPPKLQSTKSSCLRDLIRSCREMRTVSGVQRRAWEESCKIDRAIRRKYDLDENTDLDPEFLTCPIPASHASYHHKQTQAHLYASRRRANGHKRRAEDYKPSGSLLALSESAGDMKVDDSELEKARLAEAAAELQRLTSAVAAQVGYLYFIGEAGLLERWKDDMEQSNLSLIYRKHDQDLETNTMLIDEGHVYVEEDDEL